MRSATTTAAIKSVARWERASARAIPLRRILRPRRRISKPSWPIASQPEPQDYATFLPSTWSTHSRGQAWQHARPRGGCTRARRPWPGARRRPGARLLSACFITTFDDLHHVSPQSVCRGHGHLGSAGSGGHRWYAPRSSVRAAAAIPDWRRDLSIFGRARRTAGGTASNDQDVASKEPSEISAERKRRCGARGSHAIPRWMQVT